MELEKPDSEFSKEQPRTGFSGPPTISGGTAPAEIPLGAFETLAGHTAPGHAAGPIQLGVEALPHAVIPLPAPFEHYAARCRTLKAF